MPIKDCPRSEWNLPAIADTDNNELLFTLGDSRSASNSRIGYCIARRLVHGHTQGGRVIEIAVNDFVLLDTQLTGPHINGTWLDH